MTCSWCSHPTHDEACPSSIQTTSGKKPTTAPCPCSKRKDK